MAVNQKEKPAKPVELDKLVGLSKAAEILGCNPGRLRKLASKDEVPGAVRVLGRWGFDPQALEGFEVPEGGAAIVRREDGRRKVWVYVNDEEFGALKKSGLEVIDPRDVRKARKAARKAKAAEGGEAGSGEEAESGTDDPFAAFGEE